MTPSNKELGNHSRSPRFTKSKRNYKLNHFIVTNNQENQLTNTNRKDLMIVKMEEISVSQMKDQRMKEASIERGNKKFQSQL